MDRQPESRNNFIVDFVWKVYLQMSFILNYWLLVITRLFIKGNTDDARSQRKTIINSLMENFASEEIKLIKSNESAEETFERKISEKDYDSAMKLAKKFDFNMDLVYKNMWENNEIDVKLIEECLTKISNTIWTLKECVGCIPAKLDALRYLLKLGIEISSKDALMSYVETPQNGKLSQENLTSVGKSFVKYRQNLILCLKRLKLYEEILKKRHNAEYVNYFDSNYYSNFRNKSAFELAINFANQADYDSLVILFKHESNALYKHILVIIKNQPETISPIKYKDLLDLLFSFYLDGNLKLNAEQSNETDWSSQFENFVQSQPCKYESKFYQEHLDCQKYMIESILSKDILTLWLRDRALEILEFTSLVDNSLQLLKFGIEQGLPLEDLYTQLDLYSLLLYENYQCLVPFDQFEKLTLTEKLNLILGKQEAIFAIENLFDKFIQKLSNYKQAIRLRVNKKELLREFLINLAKTNFEQCLKIFESCSMVDKTLEEIQSLKIINDACDLIELAIECIHAYENPACLDMAFRVMECLPDRSQADILMGNNPAKIRYFNRINDRADQIEYYLSMIEVFRDYNTHINVKDIDSIVNNKSAANAELFFNKVINNFCTTQFGNADVSLEWKNFFWNLQDFRKSCLNMITSEQLIEMCVHNLLFSANKIFIELAIGHINFSTNKVSAKKVQYEKGKQMSKKAASDYIKFANPIQDDNIELARVCLEVFKDHSDTDEDILEELDLIEGLTIMYTEFNLDMLPIKVKQSAQPRIDLVETVLKSSKTAYTKVTKVIQLSHLLRVCKDDTDDYREGIVLSIIGKEALQNQDYQAANEVCQIILERNLQHAWDLCYLFAKMSTLGEVINSHQQLALLSFALAYCPETDIDAHFNILNEIKSIKSSINKDSPSTNFFIEFKGEISVK